MNQKNKIIFISVSIAVVILLFQITITYLLNKEVQGVNDLNLIQRQIESPLKLILNGYLGVFFNFKNMGALNYLVIPFIFVSFLYYKERERWKIAILLIYILTIIVIGLKGYFNFRYRLTLYPFTIIMLLWFIWELLQNKDYAFLKKYIIIFLLFLQVLNLDNHYHDKLKIIYNKIVQPDYKVQIKQREYKDTLVENGTGYLSAMQYIESMNTDNFFLVNNLPMFYYYTNKKGIYFLADLDLMYGPNGPKPLMEKYKGKELAVYLSSQLSCKYVFTTEAYNDYTPEFQEFLDNYCKLIFKGIDKQQVYLVYEIK